MVSSLGSQLYSTPAGIVSDIDIENNIENYIWENVFDIVESKIKSTKIIIADSIVCD